MGNANNNLSGIQPFGDVQPQGENATAKDLKFLSRELKKVSDQVNLNKRPQLSSELLTGELQANGLTGYALGLTTVLVPHGLGRAYQGVRVVRIWANAVVYEDSSSTCDRTRFIPLLASAAVTVQLEVF